VDPGHVLLAQLDMPPERVIVSHGPFVVVNWAEPHHEKINPPPLLVIRHVLLAQLDIIPARVIVSHGPFVVVNWAQQGNARFQVLVLLVDPGHVLLA
tara:strand:- start:46 stop:336 length:291 start_codon:yes stop_codon:yes gene_type:complete